MAFSSLGNSSGESEGSQGELGGRGKSPMVPVAKAQGVCRAQRRWRWNS